MIGCGSRGRDLGCAKPRSPRPLRAITDTLINRDVKLRLAATVHASLLDGGPYVRIVEELQGLKICCLDEIAGRQSFITSEQLARIVEPLRKSGCGEYLLTQLHFAGLTQPRKARAW